MRELEKFTAKEIVDYYIGYIMEHELAATRSSGLV